MIDWAPFDKFLEHTCECHCGDVFRSHAKVTMISGVLQLYSRKPCPSCGRQDQLRAARSDPEVFVISKESK